MTTSPEPGRAPDATIDESALPAEVLAGLRAYGTSAAGVRLAHTDSQSRVQRRLVGRQEREDHLEAILSDGATRPRGAGVRPVEEEPDAYRLCFERDRDRIVRSSAFRRLAGKCQVFIAPRDDMLRNRLTHAIEVSQVAVSVAQAAGLCVPLTEAMAIGHDCGHGPAGHASEEAFSPYVPGGVHDHAVWGADVVLAPLNLTVEVSDGIRNHSWKRPAPATPEGEVVSWADRIAYVCHDWNDACRAGIVSPADLPAQVAELAGPTQSSQIRYFVNAMLDAVESTGSVGMAEAAAGTLDVFRKANFELIYLREASRVQALRVIQMLQGLVEFFADAPGQIPDVRSGLSTQPRSGSPEAALAAVRYVSSMTDRYAVGLAVELLGWSTAALPRGV